MWLSALMCCSVCVVNIFCKKKKVLHAKLRNNVKLFCTVFLMCIKTLYIIWVAFWFTFMYFCSSVGRSQGLTIAEWKKKYFFKKYTKRVQLTSLLSGFQFILSYYSWYNTIWEWHWPTDSPGSRAIGYVTRHIVRWDFLFEF